MGFIKNDILALSAVPEGIHSQIKERINPADDLYNIWSDDMIVEKVDEESIVVGYYGKLPMRKINKKYKTLLWLSFVPVTGSKKKFKIKKRKSSIRKLSSDAKQICAKQEPEDNEISQKAQTLTKEPENNEINQKAQIRTQEPENNEINQKAQIRTQESENVQTEKKPAIPVTQRNIKTAKLMLLSGIFVCIALALAVITISYIGNRNFRETFYSVSSLKVNGTVRAVQISDLHNSVYGKNNSRLTERIKKLRPDIILCTGDIIDAGKKDVDGVVNMCTELAKIAPSYFVYGNNESQIVYHIPMNKKDIDAMLSFNDENRDAKKLNELEDNIEKEIEKTGVKVLKNETDTIFAGNTEIDVYGILTSNPSSFWDYSGKTFEEYIWQNPDRLKITAVHEPFIFEEFEYDFWGDLIVCGHTHGGTVRLPVIGPLFTHEGGILPERDDSFVYGRYDVSGKPIIVSGGLENSNILRINNQPELVIIDINKF